MYHYLVLLFFMSCFLAPLVDHVGVRMQRVKFRHNGRLEGNRIV